MSVAKTFVVALLAIALPGPSVSASADDQTVPNKPPRPGMIKYDSCSRPVHPEESLREKHEGTVTVRLLIGQDGKVKKSLIEKSSGYPALDEAAREGLAKCSFYPPQVEGKPVDAWTAIQYVWTPDRS